MRTATFGSAPNRQFVIEWRNAADIDDSSTRMTFEVIFTEGSKSIQVGWSSMTANNFGQGGTALIGIENANGTDALEYFYHQPNATSGRGVTFTSP